MIVQVVSRVINNYMSFSVRLLYKYSTIAMKHSTKDIILIRHAQSNFNRGFLEYKASNNCDLTWDQCIQLEDFNRKVSYAREFIDCSITEEGKEQCRRAREELKDQEIGVVLVSPYQRTLETCRQIFGGRNIRVEVHPILAEAFRYSCDINSHNDEKLKQFPDYDFSHMKDSSELWFIDNLNANIKVACEKHLSTHKELTYEEKQLKCLKLIKSKVVNESPEELRERTWKIKELLAEYRKKYSKIAVVSHFYTIGTLRARKFTENGEVAEFFDMINAKPYYESLQELLSVK